MKLQHILLISAVALMAAQCSSEKNMVKEVAYGYLDAMGNYRIDSARRYATPQTQKGTIDYMLENIMPDVDSSYLERNTPAKITIKKVEMISDSVAKVYYHKSTPIKELDNTKILRKRNGKWKVHEVIVGVPYFDQMHKLAKDKTNQ